MAEPDIVDQNGDIQILGEGFQSFEIRVLVLGKVHRESLGLGGGIGSLDLGGQGIKFRLRAGDEEDVVAFSGQLKSELLADAI